MTIRSKINKVLSYTFGVKIKRVFKTKYYHPPEPLLNTITRRIIHFYELLKRVEKIEGSIVECGVGRGRSLFILASLSQLFSQDRMFYGYDTFEMYPSPTGFPVPAEIDGVSPEILRGFHLPDIDGVQRHLIESGIDQDFIDERIYLIKGLFKDTLPAYSGGAIAFLHLDCDLYNSYRDALNNLYSKVVNGGVIAFDEYQSSSRWNGASKAVDAFFQDKKEKVIKSEIVDRYYVIKQE